MTKEFRHGQRVRIKTYNIPYYEKTRYHFRDYIGMVDTEYDSYVALPKGTSKEDITYVTNGENTFWFYKNSLEPIKEIPEELFKWEE